MIKLRPYQENSLSELRENFRHGIRRVILCAPTGSGKTVTFSQLAKLTLEKDLFSKVLILTNRTELLIQTDGTLLNFGIRTELITADNKRINLRARCFVAMAETYARRVKKHPELLNMTLVIIDECHYGTYKKLFDLWSDKVFIIGATATPISASKNDPLSNYYNAIVNPVQIADLIEDGYLCPAVTYAAQIDRSALKTDFTGEYSDKSQIDTFAKREVYAGLIEKYLEFCTDGDLHRKTIVFNVNVAHSLEVTAQFVAAGVSAVHIDGETSAHERDRIIKAYKAGEYRVICNVGILNAGFDDPATECIIMNRATTSVSLWLQCCGRGSRPFPGKNKFVILDMGDNWTDLGLWEQSRPWETIWKKTKKETDKIGVPPIKTCPSCEALLHAAVRTCPECGHVFPIKEKDAGPDAAFGAVADTKLLAASDWTLLSVRDLEQLREYKGYKPGWIIFKINDRSKTENDYRNQLRELASIRKYKRGWVERQPYPYSIPPKTNDHSD